MTSPLASLSALLLLVGSGSLWISADRRPRAPLLLLALGHLTGTAALASAVVWSLALFDRIVDWLPLTALLVLALTGLLRRHGISRSWKLGARPLSTLPNHHPFGPEPPNPPIPQPPTPEHRNLRTPSQPHTGTPPHRHTLLLLLAVAGLAVAASRVWLLPLDWDGWAIWQLKARAMVAGELKALLTDPRYTYSHVEYPLLLPSHTWWLCRGMFHEKTAQLGGLLFLCDLLALFYYAAHARVGPFWALAGVVGMLSWALVPKHTASGFADLPMAAYAFGAVVFLTANEIPTFTPLLIGATLTKNEGLFTLGACMGIALWQIRLQRGELEPGVGAARLFSPEKRVAFLGVAAAVALSVLPWAAVKRRWSLPSEFLDPSHWPLLDTTEILGRLTVVACGFTRQFLGIGPWYPGWGFTWLLAGAALFLSARYRLRETIPYWMLVTAHFAGATAAYLLTSTDPALHLDRSLDRLMLQVAPAALLATLIAFQTPRPPRSWGSSTTG